jgi:hypothetical protein
MAYPYILERDVLNGKSGGIWLDDAEVAVAKKIEVSYELQEAELKVIGTTLVQKKTTGVSYTGTMTLYQGLPKFRELIETYQDSGALPYFTVIVENRDPTTRIGRQVITLHNVKLTSGKLASLDADAEFLEEEVAFSFTHFTLSQKFEAPPEYGVGI